MLGDKEWQRRQDLRKRSGCTERGCRDLTFGSYSQGTDLGVEMNHISPIWVRATIRLTGPGVYFDMIDEFTHFLRGDREDEFIRWIAFVHATAEPDGKPQTH